MEVNDLAWAGLKSFYTKVNTAKLQQIDTLENNNKAKHLDRAQAAAPLRRVYQQAAEIKADIILNENKYQQSAGKEMYEENLMNIKLIMQQIESVEGGDNSHRRDYYMAENILYLLNHEEPGAKVVVWAHNAHIGKNGYACDNYEYVVQNSMGGFLSKLLKEKYYAIGFEFYSGTFRTHNRDLISHSRDWDVMAVGAPPAGSLPWYFNKTGKTNFFIDFRNTGADKVNNFSKPYYMHFLDSDQSMKWPSTYPVSLSNFDGMIYIKQSTAAKKFSKVYL